MNNETRLINRAIKDRDISRLLLRNVNEQWFSEETDKRLWTFLREHQTKYSECPSLEVIQENFPTYQPIDVEDNIDYLIDAVHQARRNFVISNVIENAINKITRDKDHEAALLAMQGGISKLYDSGLSEVSDVDITENTEFRWAEYLERKSLPNGMRGIPTGFPTIDKATSGLQNGQLIVVVAPPKTGKSTLIMQMAHNAHYYHGKVPMFQSFEMSNIEQQARYDAMRAKISHHRLLTGTLNDEEETRYRKVLDNMKDADKKFWLVDSAAGSTVSGIANKIQMLNPELVFIDGVYLMIDEESDEANTPRALTNITRSLKRLAQRVNKPIIISTQVLLWKMKKGSVTADSIGYSSSFFQDADVILGLQREDENIDDTRLLKVVASRNSGPAEVSLLWDWNTAEFREIDETDL